jgi:hypothetical protein
MKWLFTTPRIGMTIGDFLCILIFGALLFIIVSCTKNISDCNDKLVLTAYPFGHLSELYVKGFDNDCDGEIDYWQHYNSFGDKVGKPIWVRRK